MNEPRKIGDGLDRIQARIEAIRSRTGADAPHEQAEAIPHEASEKAVPKRKTPAPPTTEPSLQTRLHPNKRGPLILANALAEASGEKTPDADALSYYSPELIQATLPHSDPKTPVWIRQNGHFTLTVVSGYDKTGSIVGVPYGAFPRLVLAYIISQVIANKHKRQRRVELTSHFGAFLKEVGYTGNHRGNTPSAQRLKDQLNRLLKAGISFEYEEGTEQAGRVAGLQMYVAPRFELWWDFKAPEQGSLFGSWIELSDDFYNAILARPVPLKTDVLKALHKDIMALDLYMWISYRLMGMKGANKEEVAVSYGALQAQFGTGIAEANYRKFRQQLKKAFAKVAQFWFPPNGTSEQSLLRYEFTENGVILYRSPMLVSRGKRTTYTEDAASVFEARHFDEDTRKQARLSAASLYSVEHLEKQYFAWCEIKGFTPEKPPSNPRAHFLRFVKRHVTRNK